LALSAWVLVVASEVAHAWPRLDFAGSADGRAPVIEVGHDVNAAQSVRRFAVVVAAVGTPNAKGEIRSFMASLEENPPTPGRAGGPPVKKLEFALNEVRSWRITVVSGELLGSVFQVEANTANEITVTDAFGPLTGLGVGDYLLIEEIFVSPPVNRVN
jgi:hypothetical protein